MSEQHVILGLKANLAQQSIQFRKLQSKNKLLREALEDIRKMSARYRQLACGYINSEEDCDCKYIGVGPCGKSSEATGCCEFRDILEAAKQAPQSEPSE